MECLHFILTLLCITNNAIHADGSHIFHKSNAITFDAKLSRHTRSGTKVTKKVDVSLPTPDEQAYYLKMHNDYRRIEKATDMAYMEWDATLAKASQEWASSCLWGHGQPENFVKKYNTPYTYLGQNIACYSDMSFDVKAFMKHTMHEFMVEKDFVNLATMACQGGKQCGHYTQIVWAETNVVGCAVARCPGMSNIGINQEVWSVVCNYGPGGNNKTGNGVMKKPFKTGGPECSQCITGVAWCDDGLCRNKDTCDKEGSTCECKAVCKNCGTADTNTCECKCPKGKTGSDCSETCKNNKPDCGANPGWPKDWCTPDREWMYRHCPLLCGVCEKDDGSGGKCDDPNGTKNIKTPAKPTKKKPAKTTQKAPAKTTQKAQTTAPKTTAAPSKTNSGGRQSRVGVTMDYARGIDEWNKNWDTELLNQLIHEVNKWCNNNAKVCCPNASKSKTNDEYVFATDEGIEMAPGYPKPHDFGSIALFDVYGNKDNDLCKFA